MIERVLGETTGTKRTVLLGACAVTSWGFGLTSLVAGWQVGLVVLVIGVVAIGVLRRSPAPARPAALTADPGAPEGVDPDALDGPTAAALATAEERVLARLRAMQGEATADEVDPD